MPGPSFCFEQMLLDDGGGPIAGVDEAGRGPLAGPVAAAAVILDPARLPAGINDSKKMTARAREALFEDISTSVLALGIGFASMDEIERLNIREASLLAMRRAVGALAVAPRHALIDGNAMPKGLACPATTIIKGDAKSLSIAAASIIAKVARDRMMARLHLKYPQYGFAANAGYGTEAHLRALAQLGPCEFHRAGFSPVRAALLIKR